MEDPHYSSHLRHYLHFICDVYELLLTVVINVDPYIGKYRLRVVTGGRSRSSVTKGSEGTSVFLSLFQKRREERGTRYWGLGGTQRRK